MGDCNREEERIIGFGEHYEAGYKIRKGNNRREQRTTV